MSGPRQSSCNFLFSAMQEMYDSVQIFCKYMCVILLTYLPTLFPSKAFTKKFNQTIEKTQNSDSQSNPNIKTLEIYHFSDNKLFRPLDREGAPKGVSLSVYEGGNPVPVKQLTTQVTAILQVRLFKTFSTYSSDFV